MFVSGHILPQQWTHANCIKTFATTSFLDYERTR